MQESQISENNVKEMLEVLFVVSYFVSVSLIQQNSLDLNILKTRIHSSRIQNRKNIHFVANSIPGSSLIRACKCVQVSGSKGLGCHDGC